ARRAHPRRVGHEDRRRARPGRPVYGRGAMNPELRELADEYDRALEDYLAGRGEAALQEAYELGRKTLKKGLGMLDVATLQQRALLKCLVRARTTKEGTRILRMAQKLFVESLLPFEMSHRRVQEVNTALRESEQRYRNLVDTARDVIYTLSIDGKIKSLNPVFETITGWLRAEWIGKEFSPLVHPDALHDEAGQLLASVHIGLADVARDLPPHTSRRLDDVRGLLTKIEEQLRHLSHELRPTILDDLGLQPAIEFLADGVSRRTGLQIVVEGAPGKRMPARTET